MKNRFIPVSQPFLSKLELEYSIDAIKSGFISGTTGKYIIKFENAFAKFCQTKEGVACNSGTAALQLAVRAINIKKGDEVIVPAFTNIASILCIIYVGGTPVLVDSRKDTWCMDEEQVEERVTKKTKAILPVHIYGHPVKMDKIIAIADEYELKVIEDAAEAHGAEYENRPVGGIGDIGCFSFYANKIITTGEGGMVVTNNKRFAEKMRSMRNLSFGDVKRYLHKDLGYNFRMTNVQAAMGVAQMERVEELIERKITIASLYTKYLKNVNGLTLPVEMPWAKNVYWMYGIVLDKRYELTKEELMQALYKRGIETRSFFVPMEKQPALRPLFEGERYGVAEKISRNGLYLPSGMGLKREQIEYVCNAIRELSG